jgi:hypothetical protein
MNPSHDDLNDINYLFCKTTRHCKYLRFKGKHCEPSLIRERFPKLGMDTDDGSLAVPPRTPTCAQAQM